MSKKWMKVDPTTLKVGDRFKAVKIRGDHSKIVATGVVEDNDFEFLYDTTSCHWFIDNYQWYIRSNEPKKAKPPTRPDEPPVGAFFRVDRTGELYLRMHEGNGDYGYVSLLGDREGDLCTWTDITDHGDTITLLDLVERES